MRIGAHMSVAGGVRYAVERAALHGCESLQIFTRNPNRWTSPALDADDVRAFRTRVDETDIAPVISHASYLINLASTSPALRQQSIDALADELDRAHALNLLGVVLHPGTWTGGTEADALRLIAEGIRTAFAMQPRRHAMVLLEHTAGQGRSLGHRFEHLAEILDHLGGSPRTGICLDTCHLIASGYDIVSQGGYDATIAEFDRIVGISRLRAFHGNDSRKPCGSRVDRHEHIGAGCLGLEPFRRLLNDDRLRGLPMLIETAKTDNLNRSGIVTLDPLDRKNLLTLRRLRSARIAGTSLADSSRQ
jgi:deoxyribonuclease-4